MKRQSAAVFEIRPVIQYIEKLRVHHRRQKVERVVRGRDNDKHCGRLVTYHFKVNVIAAGQVHDLRDIERLQPYSS